MPKTPVVSSPEQGDSPSFFDMGQIVEFQEKGARQVGVIVAVDYAASVAEIQVFRRVQASRDEVPLWYVSKSFSEISKSV